MSINTQVKTCRVAIFLTLSAQLAQLGYPDVLGDSVGCSEDVLAFLRLNGKTVVLASDFGVGTEPDELLEVDGATFLLLRAVHVVVQFKSGGVHL